MSIGALSAFGSSVTRAQDSSASADKNLKKRSVILFQGDSITDDGRDKKILDANIVKALGRGYPVLAAGELLSDYPDHELKIYNRGISGHKVPDLASRWQKDTLDLKPDILSILIGVNDLWHKFAFGTNYQGTVADYENGYRELIQRTLKALPEVRIVICEPFTTRTSKDFAPLAEYAAVSKKLADEFKLTFVPFQAVIDEATKAAPAEFWLWDGVHPTTAGHALLLQAWRRAVEI